MEGPLQRLRAAVNKPLPGEQTHIHINDIGDYIRSLIKQGVRKHPGLMGPWLKTLFFSATAGEDDYSAVHLRLIMPVVTISEADYMPTWHEEENARLAEAGKPLMPDIPKYAPPPTSITPDYAKAYFTRGDTGTGDIIQLTLTTTYEVLQHPPRPWELEIMRVNTGHPEWSVAAIILGLNACHPGIVEAFYEQGYFTIPMRYWINHLKDFNNGIRRIGLCWQAPDVRSDQWVQTRKLFNCAYRSKREADWDLEYHRRNVQYPFQMRLNSKGMMSVPEWTLAIDRWTQDLAHQIVGGMEHGPRLDNLGEWFSARWGHAPSGSSTLRKNMNDVREEDSRLSSSSRPGKKCTWEAVPDWLPYYILLFGEPTAKVRTSTKPEPGLKQRALYALDDLSTIIASFASVHVEKFMNVWGIKAKQAPADVVEWMSSAIYMNSNEEMWLSLDYSDFNHEHTLQSLVMWNMALSNAWRDSGVDERVAMEKAIACEWVAYSHMNTYCNVGAENEYRMLGTLCSGHRDTARDNSALHGIYSKIVAEMMGVVDRLSTPVVTYYTGDDEDGKFSDMVGAAHYLLGHALAGFDVNPVKQRAGHKSHEFLQREATGDGLPFRPMFAALAQLASGNWYKDVHIWYDAAVQAVSDNVWELHNRGFPLLYARRLAISILDATMRVPNAGPDGKYRELEWWRYRHGTTVHPLWYGLSGESRAAPEIVGKVSPLAEAPSLATDSWIRSRQRITGVKLQADAVDHLRTQCLKESYSTLYTNERAKNHRIYAGSTWPERSSVIPYNELAYPVPPLPPINEIFQKLTSGEADRRPATADEVYSRFGMDAMFVEAAGGIDAVLKQLRPEVLCKYENIMVPKQLPIGYRRLDGALQSWLSVCGSAGLPMPENRDERAAPRIAKRQMYREPFMNKSTIAGVTIDVWLAHNGAGKTTYVMSRPGILDMDDIVRKSGFRQLLKAHVHHPNPLLDAELAVEVEAQILNRECFSVCTQWELNRWLLPPHIRGWNVQIHVVTIPAPIFVERLNERGWSQERIIRRWQRWQTQLTNLKDRSYTQGVLSETEHENIMFHTEFPRKL